ncbi:esterase/lipase family protein [Geodermatophilus sp. URMC 62]|uniref:esterase/lipase family protein n=1 Tax=Geodermatophilus sp. URMC 62 TaxID=3423414 RepID=UPI00406D276C
MTGALPVVLVCDAASAGSAGLLRRLRDELGHQPCAPDGPGTTAAPRSEGTAPPASMWVHRLCDRPHRPLETAAEDLLRLVEEVRARTGAPRVHLVADCLGGLVCRSMLQRVVPDRRGPGSGVRARDLVDRLVTVGTPHGGAGPGSGPGLRAAVRDVFGSAGADVLSRREMYEYLTPSARRQPRVPDEWDPRAPADEEEFPGDRVLCLVGTDAGSCAGSPAVTGRSATATGGPGDGLVPVADAVVDGADCAFVHRGHHELADSEEGWQNLLRFLLGDVRLTADLVSARFPSAGGLTWQAETRVSVRGLPVLLHERTAAHSCPVPVERPAGGAPDDRPVHLATTHLWSRAAGRRTRMRCVVHVRLLALCEGDGTWEDHLPGIADVDDHLVVDVEELPGDQLVAWATWGSDIAVPLHAHQSTGEPLPDLGKGSGTFRAEVRLPRSAAFLGHRAGVALSVRSTARPDDPR